MATRIKKRSGVESNQDLPNSRKNVTESPVAVNNHDARETASETLQDPRIIRERFGLTRKNLTHLTGISARSLAEWERSGIAEESIRKRLNEGLRLLDALASVMRSKSVGEWLIHPNKAFGGSKPLEVIERGEIDRINRMIYELESGAPM